MNNGKSRNLQLLFRLIILSFFTNFGIVLLFLSIQAILQEQQLSQNLNVISLYVTILTGIVTLLNLYIKQEIEKEKDKLLEENRKPSPNQPALNNSDSSVAEMVIKALNPIVAEYPELPAKENLISLINNLGALQSTKSYQMTRVWLENIDNLQNIAQRSGNMALKAYPYNTYFMMKDKNKAKESLYYNIYCCLLWIQRSFNAGDYLNTTKLPKISDKKRTISALNIIKTEILAKELQEELDIYFDELVNLIPTL